MFTFTQISSFLLCVFTTNIFIPKQHIENIGVSLFLFVSNIYTQIKYSALHLYEKNNSVKEWVNYINDMIKYMNGVDIEPTQSDWLSIFSCKNDEENKKYICNEEYIHIENITPDLGLSDYKKILETHIATNSIEKNTELLFTLKTPTFSLCNIFNENINDDVKIDLEKSTVDFINIDYTHPKMKDPINIKLDPNYLYQGNEILSKAFILRYLKYQSAPFVFSDEYTIKIVDGEINTVTLTSDQYILLKKNAYSVRYSIENKKTT